MIAYRESINADYKFLSLKCGVSPGLIAMVERAHVTHPNIVSRLQKLYSLSNLEAEELLPLNRQLHGGSYDPDRYVVTDGEQLNISKNKRGGIVYGN